MQTTLREARDWAQVEFGGAELGDRRRSSRWVGMAAAWGRRSQGTLPASFDSGSELKAAYRLLEEADVE